MGELEILATIFLVCVTVVFLVDVGVQVGFGPAIWAKWSLVWYLARYLGIIAGTLMALDILF